MPWCAEIYDCGVRMAASQRTNSSWDSAKHRNANGATRNLSHWCTGTVDASAAASSGWERYETKGTTPYAAQATETYGGQGACGPTLLTSSLRLFPYGQASTWYRTGQKLALSRGRTWPKLRLAQLLDTCDHRGCGPDPLGQRMHCELRCLTMHTNTHSQRSEIPNTAGTAFSRC